MIINFGPIRTSDFTIIKVDVCNEKNEELEKIYYAGKEVDLNDEKKIQEIANNLKKSVKEVIDYVECIFDSGNYTAQFVSLLFGFDSLEDLRDHYVTLADGIADALLSTIKKKEVVDIPKPVKIYAEYKKIPLDSPIIKELADFSNWVMSR